MTEVAGVYILEAPYAIDRLYSYYVPEELKESVVPGAIVEVPFGAGNRRMTAAVYELKDAADNDELKPVMSAACVYPPYLSGEALKICSFLKEHTLCTFGEAVRCVLPSAAISKMAEFYRAVPDVKPADVEKLDEKSAFVYSALVQSGKLSRETLKNRFGEDVGTVLTRLVKTGLVEKLTDFKKGGSNVKTEYSAYPAENAPDTVSKLRSERQLVVYDAVLASPGITREKLSTETSLDPQIVRSALSALEKKGFVRLEEKPVFRDLYSLGGALPEYRGDFTLSGERTSAEVTLWQDYLIFASLYGIAKKVAREMKDIDPKVLQENVGYDYVTMNRLVFFSHSMGNTMVGAVTKVQTGQSVAGGGGRASFGGGGGFHGGGFGGGAR